MRFSAALLPFIVAVTFGVDSALSKPSVEDALRPKAFRFAGTTKDTTPANVSSLIKERQANPLVKGVHKRQSPSNTLPQTMVLSVADLAGNFKGYVSGAGAYPGDYYFNTDKTQALRVSIVMNTAAVQQLPIVSGANPGAGGTFGFLAGMVGPINSGYNSVPYIPSKDLNPANYNYAFLTSSPSVPQGPAAFSTNADNEQPYVQTYMFALQNAASNVLIPSWTNSDGSTPANQAFGTQNDALFISSNVPATNNVFLSLTSQVVITVVAP